VRCSYLPFAFAVTDVRFTRVRLAERSRGCAERKPAA
jgi:hypothetical protein